MTGTTNADETSPLTKGAKPGYAIAFLAAVPDSQELQEHMAGIESTISSFGGCWLAHGSPPAIREGSWRGDVAVIAFPDIACARAWHESKEYQDIGRLRTENPTSWIALVEGVAPGHAADTSDAVSDRLLPAGFDPPTSLKTERFRLEPLGPQHNEADLAAWMSSIDHIRATPGYPDGNWPPRDGMTPERNMRDLRRHADDFASRKGFTFTVLDPDDNDVIGCVYLLPRTGGEP